MKLCKGSSQKERKYRAATELLPELYKMAV